MSVESIAELKIAETIAKPKTWIKFAKKCNFQCNHQFDSWIARDVAVAWGKRNRFWLFKTYKFHLDCVVCASLLTKNKRFTKWEKVLYFSAFTISLGMRTLFTVNSNLHPENWWHIQRWHSTTLIQWHLSPFIFVYFNIFHHSFFLYFSNNVITFILLMAWIQNKMGFSFLNCFSERIHELNWNRWMRNIFFKNLVEYNFIVLKIETYSKTTQHFAVCVFFLCGFSSFQYWVIFEYFPIWKDFKIECIEGLTLPLLNILW